MFEIRIQDRRLNAYRLIRGRDKEDVEQRASTQIATWEQRWKALERKEQRVSNIHSAKSQAQEMTRLAKAEINALDNLLADGCRNPIVTWDNLKDAKAYAELPPVMPGKPATPPAPDPRLYAPELTFLDKLFTGRRRSKESEAKLKLDKLDEGWQLECRLIRKAYDNQLSDYDIARARWEQARDDHAARQKAQHEEIDLLRAAYLRADKAAVEYFVEEVLSSSPYPERFPQGMNLYFEPSNAILIIDFELPNVETLPTVREVRFVASRSELHGIGSQSLGEKRRMIVCCIK